MCKTIQIKDLSRKQLEKLVLNNTPYGFNKRTTRDGLIDKLNILGGKFAYITFNKNFIIKGKGE